MAVRDAKPVSGESFPLVIVSHGFFNTPGVLSGLTENLVTKGYVVAAIDHVDDDPDSVCVGNFPTCASGRNRD